MSEESNIRDALESWMNHIHQKLPEVEEDQIAYKRIIEAEEKYFRNLLNNTFKANEPITLPPDLNDEEGAGFVRAAVRLNGGDPDTAYPVGYLNEEKAPLEVIMIDVNIDYGDDKDKD